MVLVVRLSALILVGLPLGALALLPHSRLTLALLALARLLVGLLRRLLRGLPTRRLVLWLTILPVRLVVSWVRCHGWTCRR